MLASILYDYGRFSVEVKSTLLLGAYFVFCKKILFRYAFMAGVFFSFVIECSQLILCRGLFEWDDMIDNTIGAVTGCMISNYIIKKFGKDEKRKLEDDDFDFASPM